MHLNPTVKQRRALIRHTVAARRAYNWAFQTWNAWVECRAVAIGMRALHGVSEDEVKAACGVAAGMSALTWRHSPDCPVAQGKKRCTKATCDKSPVFEQCYEPYPNKNVIHAMLVRAIHTDPELSLLKEVSSYAVREAVKDLDSAYQRFFRVKKKHDRGDHSECGIRRTGQCALGTPTFRNRKHQSWHADEANGPSKTPIEIKTGKRGESSAVKVLGLGKSMGAPRAAHQVLDWVKIKKGCRLPPPEAKLISVALSERAGEWYASVTFSAPLTDGHGATATRETGTKIGVETGVREMAVTSSGDRFGGVRDIAGLRNAERKIKLWERRKARRARLDAAGRLLGGSAGQSKGWHEAVREVQKYHELAADCRKNLLHQVSRDVVDTRADVIVMRDQAVKRMLARGARRHEVEKRNKLAPMIQQCGGLYELRRQVEYKQGWAGGTVVVAPSSEPTTRRCWSCKTVRETEPGYGPVGDSYWKCSECGREHERETNSALNLKDYSPGKPGAAARGRTGLVKTGGDSSETADATGASEAVTPRVQKASSGRSDRHSKRARESHVGKVV